MSFLKLNNVLVCSVLLFFTAAMHIPLPHPPGIGLVLPGNLLAWCFMAFNTLLVCLAGMRTYRGISALFFSPLTRRVGLATVMAGIPLLYTPDNWFIAGAVQWLGIAGGFIFYFCLVQGRLRFSHHRILLTGLAVAALIDAVVGALYLLVWLPAPGQWYVPGPEVGGVLLQKNVAATFLVTGLGAALLLWLDPACQNVRGSGKSGVTFRCLVRLLLLVAMTVVPFTLVFLQSRIGVLSGVVLVVCSGLLYARQFSRRYAIVLLCILTGVLLANALVLFAPSGSLDLTHQESTSYRLQMLQETAKMIALHPLQGWGLGSFGFQYARFLIANGTPARESVVVLHPHNEWLFGWAEGGLATVLAYLLLVIAGWRLWCQARRRDREQNTLYRRGLWVLLLPALLHTQVEFPFYLSAVLWMIFLMLLALLDGVSYGTVCMPSSPAEPSSLADTDVMPVPAAGSRVLVPRYILKPASGVSALAALLTLIFMAAGIQSSLVLTSLEVAQATLPADKVARIDMDRVESKLWNPWIYEQRFEADRQFGNLLRFNVTRESVLLKEYLQWSAGYLSVQISQDVFAYRMMILSAAGLRSQAQRLRYEAHLLFPKDLRFMPRPAPRKQGGIA